MIEWNANNPHVFCWCQYPLNYFFLEVLSSFFPPLCLFLILVVLILLIFILLAQIKIPKRNKSEARLRGVGVSVAVFLKVFLQKLGLCMENGCVEVRQSWGG